jgi:hypothetical protein
MIYEELDFVDVSYYLICMVKMGNNTWMHDIYRN